jgi:hypothetical protein
MINPRRDSCPLYSSGPEKKKERRNKGENANNTAIVPPDTNINNKMTDCFLDKLRISVSLLPVAMYNASGGR